MEYQYEFYLPGSREDVVQLVTTDQPLPHIQIGHSLFLEGPGYSTRLGYRLKIRDVEVLVTVGEDEKFRLVKTMVYVVDEERTHEL